MDFALHSAPVAGLETPLLAVPVFSDEGARGDAFAAVDAAAGGLPGRIADEEQFKAEAGKTLLVHTGDAKARRVLLVGVGKAADLQAPELRAVGAAAAREANDRKLSSIAIALPGDVDAKAAARFLAEGAALGAYRYDKWRTRDVETPTCAKVTLVSDGVGADFDAIVARAQATADGVKLARDLVNGPPVEVTPEFLADTARGLAQRDGLDIEILDKAGIQKAGMNLLLAVNAGSDKEPRFIHWTYRPAGADASTPSIAIVGKGLTFDAGGYNMKPTGSMEDMKMDMAGGAAVLGVMAAVKALAPRYVVHGIVPSTENLVSGSAFKPGDIYKSLNGKTVEIMNTDAEGRLILADALCYAERLGVDRIIDLATLTGACMVALGPHTAGLFSPDAKFSGRLKAASEATGEDLWPMPLTPKLKAMLKSPTADMKNIGERWGGAITAALFLQEFVGDRTWAHLDIAGPAFADKTDAHISKGGTGFGVMTLLELLAGEV